MQCQLCPHFCVLKHNERGKCGVRENQKGKLYSLVYEKPCSFSIDPIEKKPLYHFMPGERAISIATVGCNLSCKFCQNWEISKAKPEKYPYEKLSPEKVVEETLKAGCKIISYTYTEPTVFYEYMLDIAKLARKKGIKNVIVSNGFINPEPLKELCEYIDGANIDLKSINPEFYEKICEARLKPILEALKILKQNNVWVEITNLLISGKNDSQEGIKKLSEFVKSLGKDTVLHFSAFYPCYKMLDVPRTPEETVKKAREIALKAGLNYVYTGNILDEEGSTTFCPKCKRPLVKRQGFYVLQNNIEKGKCSFCKTGIAGMWE